MIKKILLGLVALIGALLIFVALQPSEFKVARSMTMQAPAGILFNQMNDFHKWEAWSPWAKLDPAAKGIHEGKESGVGAKFYWSGNDQIGEGRMTILESRPNEYIKIELEFIRPWAGKDITEFTYQPDGKGTKVTWTMSGQNNFIGRLFCLFMNMDKMVGGDFEKGLTNIKVIAEGLASKKS